MPLNGKHSGDPQGQFTFISQQGNSVVDYFVVSADFVSKTDMYFEVGSRVESSHMPIHLSIRGKQKKPEKEIRPTQRESITNIKWNSEKVEEFNEAINSDETQERFREALEFLDTNIEKALKTFSDTLLHAGECMRRKVSFSTGAERSTCKWFDRECISKKRDARRALNRFQRTQLETDKLAYRQKRTVYKSTIAEKKKQYKITVHQALFDNKRNSSKFWDTVRRARQRKTKHPDIAITTWQEHFQNILDKGSEQVSNEENGKSETNSPNNPDLETSETHIPELDDPVTEQEVRQAIRNMKHGKASGIDEICGEFLKYAENVVVPFLTQLFNKLYNASLFPAVWSKSVIVPIFKKGDDDNPDNYRGISLLSIVSKVFTAILNKRLYTWAEKENKISKEQAGFRKGYSTIDHIFTLVSMVKRKLNSRRGGKVYVAFVDYKKAFDTVDRDKLWETLEKLKTSSKMINMIKAIYSSVQSCVRWGAKFSEFFPCSLGVKQGCLLSPLMFSLFISEVADFVRENGKHGIQLIPGFEEIFLLLFADDIVLISSTPSGLQNQIDNLEKASKSLGLTVNLDKTKVMIFRKGGHIAAGEKWFYDGKEMEIVNSYKYLGFTLTTKLSNNSACEEYASKAKGKILDLMKTMWSLGSLDTSLFFKLFDAQIKPMLLYASEIWGMLRLTAIETAHLFACKRLLCVSNKTPNHMVYGDTGRYPLYIESTLSSLRYWLKLRRMPTERFPKQALIMMQNDIDNNGSRNTRSWASDIKHCLESYGFQDVWTGEVANETAFLSAFKCKMIERFQQEWYSKVSSSERFATYCTFKSSHVAETYLNDITIKKFRDALVRLRFGINELRVNKRYESENIVNKDCAFCPGILEDETHFLFHCPLYSSIRHKHIAELMAQEALPTLRVLLEAPSALVSRKVAMYVFYALKLREEEIT